MFIEHNSDRAYLLPIGSLAFVDRTTYSASPIYAGDY